MNWDKWTESTPEKQVEMLRVEYYYAPANNLEEAHKNITKSKGELELLRGCLDAEVVLLRAENALLKEYSRHSPAERKIMTSFVEQRPEITKTVKQIAEHVKRVPILEEKIAAYRKLRADSRAFLKEQCGLLAGYIEDCLEIGEKPPDRGYIWREFELVCEKLQKQGVTMEEQEHDPEIQRLHAILAKIPMPGKCR